ncbi:DUF5058 family protein [Fusibacter paucivorans]|uniref:DUF5058 family protein n=1 Tax=Fusibacter paucivorans TaxID=76009 RepID=A0ABS5PJT8_9FIRM|nr:DUF5058 family protein [Fusibacter paucivorans]MBS7525420.1 DUF5058 family protein [Fusibacter paucivorans]
MTFFEISNSKLLYGLVIIGLLYILGFAAVFLKRSYQRCVELGIDRSTVNDVIKSSLAFTLVPSIAIVIGFFSLSAVMGIPWPWWRLSVLGSVGYELMAADLASKGMSYANVAAMAEANDPQVFSVIMIVMTIGILGGFLVLLPFGKKMTTGLMAAREKKDSTWGIVMSSCFMLTLASVFLPVMIFGDAVSAATLFTSALITLLMTLIIKQFKIHWLSNFVLAVTLLLSMVASVGWQSILG